MAHNNSRWIRTLLSCTLAATCFFTPLSLFLPDPGLLSGNASRGNTFANIAHVQAASMFGDHAYVAESTRYRLYMKEEDLSLIVEDKETGAYMESAISYDDGKNNDSWLGAMKSAIVLTMINGNDDTQQADLINDEVNKQITYTGDGFEAKLYWSRYQFGMTLQVSITDEGVVARIPEDSIHEDGTSYYIGTLALYPYMGTSYLDEKEGYIFVPDGNGALIYLNDKEGRFKSGFSGMIYGSDIGIDESDVTTLLMDKYNTISDAEEVIAPVFGIAHTDDELAYLGIVEDGEARATIECIPNGVSVDYNRAFARFILRKTYTQPTSNNSTAGSLHIFEADRSHSDLQVRYIFLSGENASYSGMAAAYRNYLTEQGILEKKDTSYRTRIDFLGEERESFVLGTRAVTMTTVEDIREIYEDLQKENVTDLLTVYKGWQDGGLYSLPIDSFRVSANIGGKKKLLSLIEDLQDSDVDFYLYNNALLINPDEKNATFNVVKKINKRRFELTTYKDVYQTLLYVTPLRSRTLLERYIKSAAKAGAYNLALSGISKTLFSYNYRDDTYSRFDTQESYRETIQNAAEKTELILEQPCAYLWQDTQAFLDMPLYTSSYIFEDESIPFLSMVLKGSIPVYARYVNFEANKQEFFLKMVESGSFPSFYITKESSAELIYTNSCDIYSSEYTAYKSTIATYTKALSDLAQVTQDAYILSHEILEKDLIKVTYSNKAVIYINYGAKDKTADGITIPAMSYEVSR